ncbi:MAG: hypothetical protein M1820_001298 [Bogoriella megaspora]|nr:MAG: hypothetical protein M1820_001298 [Bogoriella megaspora]
MEPKDLTQIKVSNPSKDCVPQALKQARNYLGPLLRPSSHGRLTSPSGNHSTCNLSDTHPLFIAIDIEAFESAMDKVTEIGISTFEMNDVNSKTVEPNVADWFSQIHTRHLRVEKHKELVNKEYVRGCPDKFDFGTSEWICLHQIESVMESAFYIPRETSTANPRFCDVVLVGHTMQDDVKFLESIGVSLESFDTIIATIDTQEMSSTITSLQKLTLALGDRHEHLHNAGNDAHYTMRAFLQLAAQPRIMGRADFDNVVLPAADVNFKRQRRQRRDFRRKKAEGRRLEQSKKEQEST